RPHPGRHAGSAVDAAGRIRGYAGTVERRRRPDVKERRPEGRLVSSCRVPASMSAAALGRRPPFALLPLRLRLMTLCCALAARRWLSHGVRLRTLLTLHD